MPVGLVLLNLIVYWGVQGLDFVNWDDSTYLTENEHVQQGLSFANIVWALTTSHSPYWHPLTWMSHMLDVSLFGMNPGPHHVTSLIIHIANCLLVFLLLKRMTGAVWPSAFVGAMFAVHPLHVESVAWLAERKDVLSSFFLLVTIWLYVRYVERPGRMRYGLVIAGYALALMSKPMVVTLPFALLLLDVWPLRRASMRTAIEKAPLLVLALLTSGATFIVQKQVGAVAGLSALPLGLRIQNAIVGYVAYVRSTLWPSHLAAFYPLRTPEWWAVAGSAALLIATTVIVFSVRRRHPYLLVGWLWYVVTVAPVIGLVQAGEQARADRFVYIPILGLLIAIAWTVRDLAAARSPLALRWGAAAVVVAFTVAARAQASTWENSVTLWRHAARVTDGNYIAYENMGQALRERGQLGEAEANYRKALELAPAHSPGYVAVVQNSIGMVLTRQGRTAEALQSFAAAVQANETFAEAQVNLANALAAENRPAEAIPHYERAIALKAEYVEPRVGLGGALLRQGRAEEAMVQYREALRLDPNLAEAHNGLGSSLAMLGQDEAAMNSYREALRLKPELPTAHLNVAILLVKKGDVAEARRHLETALRIDPGYLPARQALQAITPKA